MEQLTALLIEMAEIERQQQDPTLSHSDQQLLDQAWEDIDRRIEELEDEDEDMSSIEDEDEDEDMDGYQTPPRIAPPPPPPGAPIRIIIPQMTDEEITEYWNSMDDTRSDCGCRDGCVYCTETPPPRYDPSGEI